MPEGERGKYYKYHDYQRSPVSFFASAGYRYLADNNTLFRGEGNPYVRFNLVYGDPFDGETTKPYDYFTLDATFGLSSNQPLITGLHLLGRLWSVPWVSVEPPCLSPEKPRSIAPPRR